MQQHTNTALSSLSLLFGKLIPAFYFHTGEDLGVMGSSISQGIKELKGPSPVTFDPHFASTEK